jgi:hypothetical protein
MASVSFPAETYIGRYLNICSGGIHVVTPGIQMIIVLKVWVLTHNGWFIVSISGYFR